MNLHQIEAFRTVMRTGSMTVAAQALQTSQPSVSRFIRQLEASTQLQLFERRSGRVIPTNDGTAFYHEVERAFVGLRSLEQAAHDIRLFGSGRLRIAALPALALGFLPRVIRRFKQAHPEVTISLHMRSSNVIVQWTAAQYCDIGLAANVSEARGVDVEPFLEADGVCVLPPGHRLARKRVLRARDLEGESFISLTLEDAARSRIDELFERAGVSRVLSLETQYGATICALVAQGLGVSIVNPIVARDFAHTGIVVRPLLPPTVFKSALLFPKHQPRSRLAVSFGQALRDALADELAGPLPVRQ